MDTSPIEHMVSLSQQPGGRRTALRTLGAMGAALLATVGVVETASAKKKRKSKPGPVGPAFATRVEFSAPSDPLPVSEGSTVQATADCGGEGRVVSCGHQVSGDANELLSVIVAAVKPNNARSSCSADMTRVVTADSVEGVTIQAIAICLV